MRRRISPATVIASVALFFSLGGVGVAATGVRITSLWQIAPKVRHALRGATGPQGPAGRVGLPGAPGVQGPAGPQGAAGQNAPLTATLNKEVTISSGQDLATTISCPLGSRAARGGISVSPGSSPNLTINGNGASASTLWTVEATNTGSQPMDGIVWTICEFQNNS